MNDVPFQQIPANIRRPLFYAETSNALANTVPQGNLRALIIGQMTATGTAAPGVPVLDEGPAAAVSLYGAGSVGAMMADTYRKNDTYGEVWHLPVADDPGATGAAGAITFTAPPTADGTLSLYVGGVRIQVGVTAGMTLAEVASAVEAAIAAAPGVPVTASAAAGVIDLTAVNKGETGNHIDIRVNYLGGGGGETTPAGLAFTITAMTGGATNPSLVAALANLGAQAFEFIITPYSDTASLTAIGDFLNDASGRWAWNQGLYGHGLTAMSGTYAALGTFGQGLNDPHLSLLGFYDSPTPPWQWAAALGAQTAISVRADAAQPIREVILRDVLAPPMGSRFSGDQRNALLFDGVSTFNVVAGGNVVLEKLITTYQLNAFGQPDNSFLDAETMFNIAFVLRDMAGMVTSIYGRTKLAADNSRLAPGRGVTTPAMIRASLIAEYLFLESQGFVQASDQFATGLVVQQNSTNPNRVDVLWPGVLINRLDVFAVLNQFRLMASTALAA